MEPITDEKKASRYARVIMDNISLYEAKRVEDGIKNDNLFEVLREQLEEGRKEFDSRVSANLDRESIFTTALVDVLFKRSGKYDSEIW
jgi:hypothetical protein